MAREEQIKIDFSVEIPTDFHAANFVRDLTTSIMEMLDYGKLNTETWESGVRTHTAAAQWSDWNSL